MMMKEKKTTKTTIHNGKITKYSVKKGDSLWLIANRFGISVNDLLRWNNLKRNRPIKPGQILEINIKESEKFNNEIIKYVTEHKRKR